MHVAFTCAMCPGPCYWLNGEPAAVWMLDAIWQLATIHRGVYAKTHPTYFRPTVQN